MEVFLEQKDASDWTYRGEGAANLVLAYNGSSPAFVGKVLRIQKAPRNGSPRYVSETKDGHSSLTSDECRLWKQTEGLVSAPTKKIAEQLYVQHVITPLLGSGHVDAGIRVHVSRDFLESVEKNVLCQRPSWRVDAAKVNTLCDTALLISDHSVFPRGGLKEEVCISVEIKPKCGFLPFSRYISERNAIKKRITRFKMHQSLKLRDGEVSEISEYDPLDMFSGSKDRVHKAIKALFVTPQNNFRLFLNGSLVYGGLGGGGDKISLKIGEAFEGVLRSVIRTDDGLRTTNFLCLVAEAVFKSGLLDRLLKIQKLDIFDIEGAIHSYYDFMSEPCMVCRDLGEDKVSERYMYLHSLPYDESLKIVRDYLIAATAKDLSMMICFRPREEGDVESPYSSVFLKSTNQTFDFKASFIDLDMKLLNKMERYYELDQQIVSCNTRITNGQHQVDNCVPIEAYRTGYSDQSNTVEDASRAGDPAAKTTKRTMPPRSLNEAYLQPIRLCQFLDFSSTACRSPPSASLWELNRRCEEKETYQTLPMQTRKVTSQLLHSLSLLNPHALFTHTAGISSNLVEEVGENNQHED